MGEEINIEVYAEGLSRIDRVLDDSGYAFTALDINVCNLDSAKSH